MASGSCNWPQHRHEHAEDHQHQQPQQRQRHHQYRPHPHPHQQHKFTSRSCMKQFHNNSLVMFVALALLISPHKVLSESSVDMDHHPEVTNEHKAISELSVDMDQQPEVNNDILSTITEVSPQIKIAPEFINSHAGTKSTESTDNLEQSIRNSVKTEIEMEQGLEPSPVLEILKDIAEPEIRKTLTEDLIEPTLNQNNQSPYIDFDPEENVGHIENQTEVQPDVPIEIDNNSENSTVDETKEESGNNLENQTEFQPDVPIEIGNNSQNFATPILDPQVTNEFINETSELSPSPSMEATIGSKHVLNDVSEESVDIVDESDEQNENNGILDIQIAADNNNETSLSSSLTSYSKNDSVNKENAEVQPEVPIEIDDESQNTANEENETEVESENKTGLHILDDQTTNEIKNETLEVSSSSSSSSMESSSSENSHVSKVGEKNVLNEVNNEPEMQVDIVHESGEQNENNREARNLEVQIANDNNNNETSSSSSESNSAENSQESMAESKNESKKYDSFELEGEQQTSNNEEARVENSPSKTTEAEELVTDLSIPEVNDNVNIFTSTPATDIAFFDDEESAKHSEGDEEALSVVLEESLSSTVPSNEDESLMNSEQMEVKTSLNIIAEEETTAIPEESEHIVIKKVLDDRNIFDGISGTTVFPLETSTAIDKDSNTIIEVPNPTIIEESIPEEQHNMDASNREEYSYSNIEVNANPEKVVDQQTEIAETENDSQSYKQVNEDRIIVTERVTSESSTYNEETATEQTMQTEVNSGRMNLDDNMTETVHIQSTEEGKEESIYISAASSTTESAHELNHGNVNFNFSEEPEYNLNLAITTASDVETASHDQDMEDQILSQDVDYSKTMKGSRSVNTALIDDDAAATMFETYPPQDAGQTFNGNLADESAGIGKALPVSNNNSSNRSTTIIILSSGTAFLFIVVSVTIFLISFQRQHGTLDIEMQERSCGKDNLEEEDETFVKLLEVELPPSVAIALEETEECL